MSSNELSTETKILKAALEVFQLFGYHGTTLRLIADKAGVNSAAIHYYFRSKEGLYIKVVKNVLDFILNKELENTSNRKKIEKPAWFLSTELYNNKELFERALIEIYPYDWDKKIIEIKKCLEF